jgi:plastocyanin
MKAFNSIRFSIFLPFVLVLAVLALPRSARAQQDWHATVGAQSNDMAKQALAFLPNEIWIHAGDTITWTWQSDEIHTLTFLTPGQAYPFDFTVGCPGFASSGTSFDGSACVTTPPMVKGQTFTVRFPSAGNYKFECLVHNTMTGAIHVLNASDALLHNQDFYDAEAADEQRELLTDTDHAKNMDDMAGMAASHASSSMSVRILSRRNRLPVTIKETAAGGLPGENPAGGNQVKAGVGELTSTPGGYQQLAIVRFLNGTITIHVGETVEWSNHDPNEPHTITFGADPTGNPFPPSANVTVDSDGALHAIITSPSENLHSGAILQALEDEGGVPSNTLAANPTRFRATFTSPGTYNYHCFFHDNLGMVGNVIVLP